MDMNSVSLNLKFIISILFLSLVLVPISFSQLTPSENRILFQIQEILEFPPALQGFSNWTNFCFLNSTQSLTILCSENHITELTIVGNKFPSPIIPKSDPKIHFSVSDQTLSEKFSIDSFFTILTKLSNLKVLSLVSLGIWGPLPSKINRFKSLETLNLSSNSIYGEIPTSISTYPNLKSLVLSDNLFNGSVPNLSSLSVLEELDLSRNLLGPEFPSIGKKVVSIILRNNKFVSTIPFQLKKFTQLQKFDIASNQLIGNIPPFLISLPSMGYLNLAGNQLTGTLPIDVSCSKELKFVDFSHNLLSGKVPLCIRSNSSNLVVLYSWNCFSVIDSKYQHPNSFCNEEALAVKPPMKVEEKSSSTTKLGLILGIVGGVLGGFVVLGLLVLIIVRKHKGSNAENTTYEKAEARKDSLRLSPMLLTDARHVSPTMRLGAIGLPQYHVFTMEEIEEATNNFDPANLMGDGSNGQLYKGRLSDGSVVVVRCFKMQKLSAQNLLRHMEVISNLRHRHLVSILGHCIVSHDYPSGATSIFLIFEYISNGALANHLTDWRKKDMMKWSRRLAVTIGAARGIQFLHTGVTPGIFGNNIKIESILLDDNLTAKISTYFLPMPFMAGSESSFRGVESVGHIESPEDGEKDDVYQLGVILLELITGKVFSSQSEVDVQRLELERASTDASSQLLLREIADPSLRGTFSFESLKTAVELTVNCLSKDLSQRPSIEDVLWHLQYSIQVQEGWMASAEIPISQTFTFH